LNKKYTIIFILVVLVVGTVVGVKVTFNIFKERLAGITVSDVNLAKIADGTYSGSCSVFPVSVEVSVTVKNRAITKIELDRHKHGQGAAAEVIPERVVKAQSLLVDTISGATYSSNVILKAIENALTGASQ
jgi:uncharacterized protein with FMN-binding domain